MPSRPPGLKAKPKRKPWQRDPNKPDNRIRGRRGKELRRRRLANSPICELCKEAGIVSQATVPDHIVPLAKGGEDVDSNIRCLCHECHDRVTREEFGRRPRRTIGEDGWPIQE